MIASIVKNTIFKDIKQQIEIVTSYHWVTYSLPGRYEEIIVFQINCQGICRISFTYS